MAGESTTKRVVVLTGSELRHRFFRKALALSNGIDLVASYCETPEGSLRVTVESRETPHDLLTEHLTERERSEDDFFGTFDRLAPDRSHPTSIRRGALNDRPELEAEARDLQPDVLVCYGTSIIREPFLSQFEGRFLNIHLGLSPYYRGSGTNFWPLVNNQPEYVGVTFMHIDAGVDTGEIIHQMRPAIYANDGPHQIGNRLIKDAAFECAALLREFENLYPVKQPSIPADARYYRKRDFVETAVRQLRANFRNGMIERFLAEGEQRFRQVPIIRHPVMEVGD